ncbi:MAG: CBS domain-containing protein [Rhodospirillaceae bacterium]
MPQRQLIPHVVNNQVITALSPNAPVSMAVKRMVERRISAVLITEDGSSKGKLLGIFTERDVLVRIVETGRSPRKTRVGDVMTRSPDTLPATARVIDALAFMRKREYHHLPVVDGDVVVGIISVRNLFSVVTEQL